MEKKELIKMEIGNFIINWTSDDKEREEMRNYLEVYMEEGYTEEELLEEYKDGETEESLLK